MNGLIVKSGILGIIAVIGGAFGAHALKEILTLERLASFNTGVHYQLIHAIVLLAIALFLKHHDNKYLQWSSKFIFLGIILFSGSIYVLTLKNLTHIEWLKYVGPITPIGGLLMILGWFFVIKAGLKINNGLK